MDQQNFKFLHHVPIYLVKHLLSLTGLWPMLTPSKIFVRTFIINVDLIVVYSAQIITIATTDSKMEKFLDLLAYFSTSTCLCIIYYSGLFNKRTGIYFLERIIKDHHDLMGTKEYKILIKYATLTKFCVIMFIVSYMLYISLAFLYACKPFFLDIVLPLNETRPRILLYPVDWLTKDEKYFMKLLILQYVLIVVTGMSAISNLSAYVVFLQHTCAMFKIVGCLLDNILEDKEKQLCVCDDHVVYAKIIRIIGFHNRTIEFMDILNAQFNVIYLVTTMCILCFTGVCITQLLRKNETVGLGLKAIPLLMYLFSHVVWVFLFCYMGQHVEDISWAVFDKTYATPWYLMSKRSKMLLFFMITRTRKPTNVSIGKMFIASNEFFASLMRLAVSFATVFYSLN